jgi:MFS transporter, PHS family, inorganic phosphate transporter
MSGQPQARHFLTTLDLAQTQLYHFTTIVISGTGFFTDGISLVMKLIGRRYYTIPGSSSPGVLPPNVARLVSGVTIVGTLTGQLYFDWLGDKMAENSLWNDLR